MNPMGRIPRVKGPPENPVTGHLAFHVGFGLDPSGLLAGLDLNPASTLCVSPSSVAMLSVAPLSRERFLGIRDLNLALSGRNTAKATLGWGSIAASWA